MSSLSPVPETLRLLDHAIARDLSYGPALAWAAICHFLPHITGQSEELETDVRKGTDLARRALQVAGDDPSVLANAAAVLAYFGEDIGAMMALVDRALALNPSYARGWHTSGVLRVWAGEPDAAIEHIEVARRLSPRARTGPSLLQIGFAHFLARRFDKAVPQLLLALQEDPSFSHPYRVLAACYAQMGRLADAREIVERLRTITSVVVLDVSYLRKAEHRELFLSGLRLTAGEAASTAAGLRKAGMTEE